MTIILTTLLNVFALESKSGVTASPIQKTTQTWENQPLIFGSEVQEMNSLTVNIAPGAQTGWHLHPVFSFAYVMQGTLQVELKDGSKNILKAGQSLAEVKDILHNGTNIGADTVKLIVFYLGKPGTPLTHKEQHKE
jgi:quercetin dioxygenase-like cupin family protein